MTWALGKQGMALMAWEGGCLYVRVAGTFPGKLKGLLGSDPGDLDGAGLRLDGCSSIHTFGMRYPLDILFLDGDGRVLRVVMGLGPGRTRTVRGSSMVVERPSDGGLWPGVGQMVRFHPCDGSGDGVLH